MRALILFLCSLPLLAQGTVPTNGTWTPIAAHGAPGQLIGYEGTAYVPSIKAVCGWGAYHTLVGAGENDTSLVCYSYSENRWFILAYAAGSHDEHNGARGHPVGTMIYVPELGSLFWMSDGSGTLGAETFLGHWWQFDVAGNTSRHETAWGTHQSAWSSNGVTPSNCMAYDTTNKIGVVAPDWIARASRWNPAAASTPWTSTNNTGVPSYASGFPSCTFDSTNGLVYFFGGGGAVINTYNVLTDTWATIIPASCTGADCVGVNPPARYSGFFLYSSTDNKFLMGGGSTNIGFTGSLYDTWIYDPVANTWTEQSPGATYQVMGQNLWNTAVYDSDDNVFIVWMLVPTPGNYADGTSSGVGIYVYPMSTALGYGRTVNTYTPTSGSLNITAPTATSNASLGNQSYAIESSIAVDGSGNLYAAWGETSNYFDLTTCSGLMSTYVKTSTDGGATWSQRGSGCSALRSLGTGSMAGYHPHTAIVGSTQYVVQDEFDNGGTHFQWAYLYSWGGSSFSGAQVGCFSAPCSGSISAQTPDDLISYNNLPTFPVLETSHAVNPPVAYLYVVQCNMGTCSALGGAALNNGTTGSRALGASLVADGLGNLFLCWNESVNLDRITISTNAQIFCREWNGSTWSSIFSGATLNSTSTSWAGRPGIAWNAGVLYMAWSEMVINGNPKLVTATWNGSARTILSSNANHTAGGSAYNPQLSVGATGPPYMAWEEQSALGQPTHGYVDSWTGSAWASFATNVSGAASGSIEQISMAVAGGNPAIAWAETSTGNLRQIYSRLLAPAVVGAGSVLSGQAVISGAATI